MQPSRAAIAHAAHKAQTDARRRNFGVSHSDCDDWGKLSGGELLTERVLKAAQIEASLSVLPCPLTSRAVRSQAKPASVHSLYPVDRSASEVSRGHPSESSAGWARPRRSRRK